MDDVLSLSDAWKSGKSVLISLEFLDDNQARLVSQYPIDKNLILQMPTKIRVPIAEIFTYFLFHKRRENVVGRSNFHEISSLVEHTVKSMSDDFLYKNENIYSNRAVHPISSDVIGRLGEAISLSSINRIVGIHEADWNSIDAELPLPIGKRMDYNFAATENTIFELEAKGIHVLQKDTFRNRAYKLIPDIREKKSSFRK